MTLPTKSSFPVGWDEERVAALIDHYETQSEDEAVAEDEAARADPKQAVMVVPAHLVPAVRKLLARTSDYASALCAAIREYDFPTVTCDFDAGEKEIRHADMGGVEDRIRGLLISSSRKQVKDGLSNVLYWGYANSPGSQALQGREVQEGRHRRPARPLCGDRRLHAAAGTGPNQEYRLAPVQRDVVHHQDHHVSGPGRLPRPGHEDRRGVFAVVGFCALGGTRIPQACRHHHSRDEDERVRVRQVGLMVQGHCGTRQCPARVLPVRAFGPWTSNGRCSRSRTAGPKRGGCCTARETERTTRSPRRRTARDPSRVGRAAFGSASDAPCAGQCGCRGSVVVIASRKPGGGTLMGMPSPQVDHSCDGRSHGDWRGFCCACQCRGRGPAPRGGGPGGRCGGGPSAARRRGGRQRCRRRRDDRAALGGAPRRRGAGRSAAGRGGRCGGGQPLRRAAYRAGRHQRQRGDARGAAGGGRRSERGDARGRDGADDGGAGGAGRRGAGAAGGGGRSGPAGRGGRSDGADVGGGAEQRGGGSGTGPGGADLHVRTVGEARPSRSYFRATEPTGFTPLLFAVRAGGSRRRSRLLDAGADVNDTLSDGQSALVVAAANAHWELASRLLDRGADPALAAAGWNALHQTVRTRRPNPSGGVAGRPDGPRRQHRRGPEVDRARGRRRRADDRQRHEGRPAQPVEPAGATAFFLAAKNTDTEAMRVLVEAGADPLIPSADATTPLMVAAGVAIFIPGEDGGSLPGQRARCSMRCGCASSSAPTSTR